MFPAPTAATTLLSVPLRLGTTAHPLTFICTSHEDHRLNRDKVAIFDAQLPQVYNPNE